MSMIDEIIKSAAECNACGVKPTVLVTYRLFCPCCGKRTSLHSEADLEEMLNEWKKPNTQDLTKDPKQANQDIRNLTRIKNVKMWEIAKELGITDGYFCKKMRIELPAEEKERIREIINRISEERV